MACMILGTGFEGPLTCNSALQPPRNKKTSIFQIRTKQRNQESKKVLPLAFQRQKQDSSQDARYVLGWRRGLSQGRFEDWGDRAVGLDVDQSHTGFRA